MEAAKLASLTPTPDCFMVLALNGPARSNKIDIRRSDNFDGKVQVLTPAAANSYNSAAPATPKPANPGSAQSPTTANDNSSPAAPAATIATPAPPPPTPSSHAIDRLLSQLTLADKLGIRFTPTSPSLSRVCSSVTLAQIISM